MLGFGRMRRAIERRVRRGGTGLYRDLVFPMATAFVVSFAASRLISYLVPAFYLTIVPGVHVHHFAYGFFILAVSGYLALVFSGARAKYLIALLHGVGLGLSFDEFAMWLRLRDDGMSRWSYDGFLLVVSVFIAVLSARRGLRAFRTLWPGPPGAPER